MIDVYTENEEVLYKLLKRCLFIDLEPSREKTAVWDCVSHKYCVIVEMKYRYGHWDTLRLEKKKYDDLIDLYNKTLYTPLYVSETDKGIYVFNLLEIEPKWGKKLCKKTTYFSDNRQVYKIAYDIPIIKGEKILNKYSKKNEQKSR